LENNLSLQQQAEEIGKRLALLYPGNARDLCALHFENEFELLAATILSAQCTDERVNMVTEVLFSTYSTPKELACADPEAVEEIVRPTGFYREKAKNLINMSSVLVENYGGNVPNKMEDLVRLPGVGRKTANVVLSVAFGLPGLPVDTHVKRLSKRLGLTKSEDPVVIEQELNELIPSQERGSFSLCLILHGRKVCQARKPRCAACDLADICPSVLSA
jgi:endonuclease-3